MIFSPHLIYSQFTRLIENVDHQETKRRKSNQPSQSIYQWLERMNQSWFSLDREWNRGRRKSSNSLRWLLMTTTMIGLGRKPECSNCSPSISHLLVYILTVWCVIVFDFRKSVLKKWCWGTERVSSVVLVALRHHSHYCASTNHVTVRP